MEKDNELMLDVGQANELKMAARRAKATNADLKRLSEGDMFALILPVIRGTAEVVAKRHVIDCDVDPFTPNGWKVEEHRKDGQLEWDPEKITLHLDDAQKNGVIEGNDLRSNFKNVPVLNANVLDYLLANPHLISEEWKDKYVFFWGTIFRRHDGYLYVRFLGWSGDEWSWFYSWLGSGWRGGGLAASLAS